MVNMRDDAEVADQLRRGQAWDRSCLGHVVLALRLDLGLKDVG
ncbi:MAG: hypothetical protein RLZZ426_32 [Actinomycetota bacterium]|jgi:hypothetical protein